MLGAEDSKQDKRITASQIRRSADKQNISDLHKVVYWFKGSSKTSIKVSAQCKEKAT